MVGRGTGFWRRESPWTPLEVGDQSFELFFFIEVGFFSKGEVSGGVVWEFMKFWTRKSLKNDSDDHQYKDVMGSYISI